ncbi:5-oxoprolinase subunit PxpA [Aquibacillus albus]|uniref:5-oxoprolinase subunit A n=1 Tax=Aquibacillus albus TaxID=1168171 RepID=A0ABS2MWL3_9BACI|nr:5-oxoprolinase subunit PxpA [Aquibacillus albus]MBM7570275.1 UPF0271 protein [Aquibacillus albus]
MIQTDLNCDMGESYGSYSLGNDQEVIKYVSSVNIACGYHAGDPATMDTTVQLAIKHNVRIGAHPGLPDLNGFGRREMKLTPSEVYQLIVYQVGALNGFVQANGAKLNHVKPHGALYNMAAKDKTIANAIAEAIYHLDTSLTLFGLSNSELTKAGEKLGIPVAHEVFADRTYQADGSLTPRSEPNAVLTSEEAAMTQIDQMIKHQTVTTVDGKTIPLKADTICIHGDNPKAVGFAKQLYQHFISSGIKLGNLS